MGRFLFSLMVACMTVQAGSIVSYSCSVGATTADPCPETSFALTQGLTDPPYGNAHASAFAAVTEQTINNVSAQAATTAFYQSCPQCPEPTMSAFAQAAVSDEDYTSGPTRSGFIRITETIYSMHANPSTNWNISGGSYDYSGCLGPGFADGCSGTQTLPFELGVPFSLAESAMGAVSIGPPQAGGGTDDSVQVLFSIFEADGTTPVAVLATPDPPTDALMVCAVAVGLVGFAMIRRRAAPSVKKTE